jgi:hypothetical protein
MSKFKTLFACVLCAWMLGCEDKPGSVQRAALNKPKEADASEAEGPPPQSEPPIEEMVLQEEPASEAQELTLEQSGVTFLLPAGWKQVKPDNKVVEAEFELPRADGDAYDGRLTLMSSGGLVAETMANRTSEFKFNEGEGPAEEKLEVSGIESTLLDLRGQWKGPSFRPIEPRTDYRMLLLVVPFSERSAFYAKLTGPRATIAAHEDEFRDFLKTAKIKR